MSTLDQAWMEQHGARAKQLGLDQEEMKVCGMVGVDPDRYAKAKGDLAALEALRNGEIPDLSYLRKVRTAEAEQSGSSLSAEEARICEAFQISQADYLKTKEQLRVNF